MLTKGMESIHPFIHRKVVVLNEDTPAQDAAKAMRDKHIGCVIVTDAKGRIAGIVTDRDFASRLTADFAVTSISLSQIMTPNVVTASTNTRLADIVHLMETHGIRRIPLVEPGGGMVHKCVGIITLDDLIASKFVDIHQLSRIVQRQIGRRMLVSQGPPHTGRRELRSEASSQQVLQHFYERIPVETSLPPDRVHQITNYLLGSLAMRLSFTAAAHLAAQLPKTIQDHILTLPPGPDRSITADKLRTELRARFNYSDEDALRLLHKFFSGLDSLIDSGEVEHVKAQLPKDLLNLFAPFPEALPEKEKKIA